MIPAGWDGKGRRTEDRGQRAEVRGQTSEVGGRRPEIPGDDSLCEWDGIPAESGMNPYRRDGFAGWTLRGDDSPGEG